MTKVISRLKSPEFRESVAETGREAVRGAGRGARRGAKRGAVTGTTKGLASSALTQARKVPMRIGDGIERRRKRAQRDKRKRIAAVGAAGAAGAAGAYMVSRRKIDALLGRSQKSVGPTSVQLGSTDGVAAPPPKGPAQAEPMERGVTANSNAGPSE